jgi:hypothetical protein
MFYFANDGVSYFGPDLNLGLKLDRKYMGRWDDISFNF